MDNVNRPIRKDSIKRVFLSMDDLNGILGAVKYSYMPKEWHSRDYAIFIYLWLPAFFSPGFIYLVYSSVIFDAALSCGVFLTSGILQKIISITSIGYSGYNIAKENPLSIK